MNYVLSFCTIIKGLGFDDITLKNILVTNTLDNWLVGRTLQKNLSMTKTAKKGMQKYFVSNAIAWGTESRKYSETATMQLYERPRGADVRYRIEPRVSRERVARRSGIRAGEGGAIGESRPTAVLTLWVHCGGSKAAA